MKIFSDSQPCYNVLLTFQAQIVKEIKWILMFGWNLIMEYDQYNFLLQPSLTKMIVNFYDIYTVSNCTVAQWLGPFQVQGAFPGKAPR